MNASLRSERLLQYYLATLFEAGISLVQALTALYEECDPKRQRNLRRVIWRHARMQGGETFGESISKHRHVFSRLFVSAVKAGEHGGLLAEILDRLAGFSQRVPTAEEN